MPKFLIIDLTEKDLAILDDGQGWWKDGDDVALGGYMPEGEDDNPAFALSVNEYEHDSWVHWADLPDAIQLRLADDGRGLPRGREGGRRALSVNRRNITITDELWQKAAAIGDGNASEGIRRSLDEWGTP